MPSISMKPLVPSNPGPPNDPNSFWAPWPAISDPCARRTINGADSLTLEPLDIAVLNLAPSVIFTGLVNLPSGRRPARVVYPRRYGRIPTLRPCPRSPTWWKVSSPELVSSILRTETEPGHITPPGAGPEQGGLTTTSRA